MPFFLFRLRGNTSPQIISCYAATMSLCFMIECPFNRFFVISLPLYPSMHRYLHLVLDSSSGVVQQQALMILQKVSAGTSASDMTTSGIVQPLIRILTNGGDAAPEAISMLLPLAQSSQTASALVDAGSVAAMISLCQQSSASDAIRTQTFELLLQMANADARCVQQLIQSAAPNLLLDTIHQSTLTNVSKNELVESSMKLLVVLCNERVCSLIKNTGGIDTIVACLQSSTSNSCRAAAIDIIATLAETDSSVADIIAENGVAHSCIPLLTEASATSKAFISSLLNRADVLQNAMASLRSNEPLMTLMIKNFVSELEGDSTNYQPVFSLQTFCSLPDDGHVMLQMRRLQIANAAGKHTELFEIGEISILQSNNQISRFLFAHFFTPAH